MIEQCHQIVGAKSSILALAEVKQIKDEQRKRKFQFDENPLWHGWKYVGSHVQRDEFLRLFIEEPESLWKPDAKEFWDYLVDTHELVLRANKVLQER